MNESECAMSISNKNSFNSDVFYNLRDDTQKYLKRMKEVRTKQDSFGSQNININDFILSPEGWETLMFTIYFFAIPYLIGILFLFLFIAHASVSNFFVLEFGAFLIVWAIGYEIIAISLLIFIFISYINYVRSAKQTKYQR